jgi:hypothetical protein
MSRTDGRHQNGSDKNEKCKACLTLENGTSNLSRRPVHAYQHRPRYIPQEQRLAKCVSKALSFFGIIRVFYTISAILSKKWQALRTNTSYFTAPAGNAA